MNSIQDIIKKAQKIFKENFPLETSFERALFFSWGCTIGDCQFCYMSTQPPDQPPRETKRSTESILAETILIKNLGWDIGFFTGGIGVLTHKEIKLILKIINEITEEKVWLSIGPVSKRILQEYLPHIKGVVGSTETINSDLHKKICPSKPLAPYEKMFESAKELDLNRAMTFIVGMGETKEDLRLLNEFIKKYEINKIHIYSLISQKNTFFEDYPIPTKEEQAFWIANLRINFPRLDIQAGIWEDRVERISYLLEAGANSVSKFKALKLFGTPAARQIEIQAKDAGRTFKGTLTNLPDINWNRKVDILSIDSNLKKKVQEKLNQYLKVMQDKNTNSNTHHGGNTITLNNCTK